MKTGVKWHTKNKAGDAWMKGGYKDERFCNWCAGGQPNWRGDHRDIDGD
jgi:hypothetical protein